MISCLSHVGLSVTIQWTINTQYTAVQYTLHFADRMTEWNEGKIEISFTLMVWDVIQLQWEEKNEEKVKRTYVDGRKCVLGWSCGHVFNIWSCLNIWIRH